METVALIVAAAAAPFSAWIQVGGRAQRGCSGLYLKDKLDTAWERTAATQQFRTLVKDFARYPAKRSGVVMGVLSRRNHGRDSASDAAHDIPAKTW